MIGGGRRGLLPEILSISGGHASAQLCARSLDFRRHSPGDRDLHNIRGAGCNGLLAPFDQSPRRTRRIRGRTIRLDLGSEKHCFYIELASRSGTAFLCISSRNKFVAAEH